MAPLWRLIWRMSGSRTDRIRSNLTLPRALQERVDKQIAHEGLGVARVAWIRQAVLERLERCEPKGSDSKKGHQQ